jgi:integrase
LFRRYIVEKLSISTGKFTFVECTRDYMLGFINYLSELKSKASTRNNRLAALRSYLRFAADKDISLQPIELEAKRVPHCRATKVEKTVLQQEAITAILEQPPNTKMGLRDRTIMTLMYDSAARPAEVLGLRVSDVSIDGDDPCIRVNSKGSKSHIVAISSKTAVHLAHYISVYHGNGQPDTQLLFYTVIKKGDRNDFRGKRGTIYQAICTEGPILLSFDSGSRSSPHVPQSTSNPSKPGWRESNNGFASAWTRFVGDDPTLCTTESEDAS